MEREQTTIRLPDELAEEFKQKAKRRGISLNALILLILEKYIEANQLN